MKPALSLAALAIILSVTATIAGQVTPRQPTKRKSLNAVKPTLVFCDHCGQPALYLPKPEYPKSATYVNANGPVSVSILIDELGNVGSAKALSGHPLLRPTALKAALQAKFPPTLIGGKPVRVRTTVVFNFVPLI